MQEETNGWTNFAGAILLVIGAANVIAGIGALDDSKFFVGSREFIFGDLGTWGWVLVISGSAQVLTALGLFRGDDLARYLAVLFITVNAFGQLMIASAFPVWAMAVLAADVLIIYGLMVHGGRGPGPAAAA